MRFRGCWRVWELFAEKSKPSGGSIEAASIKDWRLSGVGIESVVGVLMVLVDMAS